jgi:hypothetical protein
VSALVRSNGRATNRYGIDVSAPTGQIWTTLPENGDRRSSPAAIATRSPAPRAYSSRNRSPLIWSQNRVHRAHSTHRSRSSATSGDIGIGFGYTRLASVYRLSPGPNASAWSCRGHSPPRSQIGQSSGWFNNRNSRFATWASRAVSLMYWDDTTMPGATVIVQAVASFGWPSIST